MVDWFSYFLWCGDGTEYCRECTMSREIQSRRARRNTVQSLGWISSKSKSECLWDANIGWQFLMFTLFTVYYIMYYNHCKVIYCTMFDMWQKNMFLMMHSRLIRLWRYGYWFYQLPFINCSWQSVNYLTRK